MHILEKILIEKKREVNLLKKAGIKEPSQPVSSPRGFKKALLNNKGVSIIAECKKASPSKGLLCPDFDPASLARDYKKGGASCISILTDSPFFQGDIRFIPLVREEVDLPVLRKDFIIDHIQVDEARIFGADAILLITACLDSILMSELMAHARELGMDVLTEVHSEDELEEAIKAGADLIGVNNRNLKTFDVSLETTFRIKKLVPKDLPLVSESGISTPEDMALLLENGVSAALIGESLVKAKDRVTHLKRLVEAGTRG